MSSLLSSPRDKTRDLNSGIKEFRLDKRKSLLVRGLATEGGECAFCFGGDVLKKSGAVCYYRRAASLIWNVEVWGQGMDKMGLKGASSPTWKKEGGL